MPADGYVCVTLPKELVVGIKRYQKRNNKKINPTGYIRKLIEQRISLEDHCWMCNRTEIEVMDSFDGEGLLWDLKKDDVEHIPFNLEDTPETEVKVCRVCRAIIGLAALELIDDEQ